MRTDIPPLTDLVPHRGAMCLLSMVRRWDVTSLDAEAPAPRALSHPLAVEGRLPAMVAIEYAAQAAAAHGALSAGAGALRGYLTRLKGVRWSVRYLDDTDAPLCISVHRVFDLGQGSVYDFVVSALGSAVVSGRLSVWREIARV